jgi:hypothetical protein
MVRTKHRIGDYRVIAPIGAGGFSTVYRALDEESGEEVAIKVLAENHSLVRDTRRRFVDEFNLMATVHSPAIAQIYHVGQTETGQPYMVLELANRGDLRRRVEEIRRSHQVLNRADLMMLANHLAEALGTLHEADIVHRDVSPGNILIRARPSSGARRGSLERGDVTLLEPGERFLLADLGHAKDLVLASGFTAGGGTRGFAAPEQRDDVTVVDHRADIFSATAIIEWAAHDGRFADALEPFFDVGLASEPEERFDTMAQWHASLTAALGAGDGRALRSRFGRRRRSTALDPWAQAQAESRVSPAIEAALDVADGAGNGGRRRSGLTRAATGVAGLVVALALVTGLLYAVDGLPFDLADLGLASGGGSSEESETASADPEDGDGQVAALASSGPGSGSDPATLVAPRAAGESSEHTMVMLDDPVDGDAVDGDLAINGTAEFDQGLSHVELTVERLADSTWWSETGGGFGPDPTTIKVELTDIESSGTVTTRARFDTVVPASALDPGRYRIQIWARGLQAEGPAEPAVRTVEVP